VADIPPPKLGEPVNIRFPADLARAAKHVAARDGKASASEWIRAMVEREVRRREGRCPCCGARQGDGHA